MATTKPRIERAEPGGLNTEELMVEPISVLPERQVMR